MVKKVYVLQIVKNLVFLAKVLLLFEDDENEHEFTLSTLLSKTERLATYEASQTPKKTHKVRTTEMG